MDPSFIVSLKYAKCNGTPVKGGDHFVIQDVARISSHLIQKESDSFTDSAISKGTANLGHGKPKEKSLEKWKDESNSPLTAPLDTGKGTGKWNQFEVNEKLFGVTTDFKEEIYTTELNKSVPGYAAKEARASKLAREIESAPTENAHIAEERGHASAGKGMNEEDKYSAVVRQAAPVERQKSAVGPKQLFTQQLKLQRETSEGVRQNERLQKKKVELYKREKEGIQPWNEFKAFSENFKVTQHSSRYSCAL